MAFDLTKPSMLDATVSASFGHIREKFRAIVQGDDDVFVNSSTNMALTIRASGISNAAIFSAVAGNATTSSRQAYSQYYANETSPQDWRIGMQGTKDYLIRNNTASRNDLTIDTSGNVAIGGTPAANTRLRVGAGGTGATSEEMKLDSGSGTCRAMFRFERNSVLKAYAGVGSAGLIITGDAADDLGIVSVQKINFSTDSGSTRHMILDGSGNLGIGSTATLTDRLHIKKNETQSTFGNSTQFRLENSQGSGNFVGLHFAGAVSDGFIAFMDHSTTATRRLGFGCRSSNEDLIIDGNGNVVLGSLAALATTATDGFAYMPTCAGTPTGTPTAKTGKVPFVFDTTGVKIWMYTGGAWKGVVIA